jgi:hypothetical protein
MISIFLHLFFFLDAYWPFIFSFFLYFFSITFRRPWHAVLDGVDWMQNSTRILRLPFGTGSESFSKIKLKIDLQLRHQDKRQSSSTALVGSPSPTFIAQVVPDRSTVGHKVSLFPLKLAAGAHPLALQLDIPTTIAAIPVPAPALAMLLNKLLRVAIGQALPFKIHATRTDCSNTTMAAEMTTPSEHALEHSVPFLVAVDDVFKAQHSILIGDFLRKAHQGLPLWHPSVINRDIWFISDPRYRYTVR